MGGFGSQAFLGCEHRDGAQSPVVMVFLPDEIVEKVDIFDQVLSETDVAARIDHVNVIRVIGLARIDEGYARIIEYADAESLLSVHQRLGETEGHIPVSVALSIAVGACMGVHYAHEIGSAESGTPLIHGAVRPGTLLVSYRGVAKVTGYGAAVLAEGLAQARGTTLTQADSYTAPEQLVGGRNAATIQTDVYALGAILFELLTEHPAPRADAPDVEIKLSEALRAAEERQRSSPQLSAIVMKAMRRRAVERFSTALAMRDALLELEMTVPETEVASFMNAIFDADHPARMGRSGLLATMGRAKPLPSEMLAPLDEEEADEVPASSSALPPAPPAPERPPLASPLLTTSSSLPPRTTQAVARGEATAPPAGLTPIPVAAAATTPSLTSVPALPTPAPAPPASPSSAPPPATAEPKVVYRTPGALLVAVGLLGGLLVALLGFVWTQRQPEAQPVAASGTGSTGAPNARPAPRQDAGEPPSEAAISEVGGASRAAPPPTLAKASRAPRKAATPPRLIVTSEPELDILLDRKKVGRGEVTLTAKPGAHSIRAKDPRLGIYVTRKVRLQAGKTERVAIRVGKGQLNLDAPPGCDVFVDGKRVGITPLPALSLYEGQRKILVKQGATEYRHTVPMKSGLNATLTVEFHD